MRALRLVTIVALAAGCGRSSDDDAPAPPKTAVHVRVARITERSFADVVTATGQWRAANEFVVATPFAATVESLEPRVGDLVTQGETVGVLVTRESRATLRGAELMLRQAADDAARAEAERALALARRELVRVPIVASASGTVVRRSAEPGTELAESAELLAIVPRDDLVFEAHVPAADAGRVSTGQTARIVIEGVDPVVAAVQRRLPGVGDGDQSVLVWLAHLLQRRRHDFGSPAAAW